MDRKWDILNNNLKVINPDYVEPQLPFDKDTVLAKFNDLYARTEYSVQINEY